MKHLAIITFHRTTNYGAALQAFALQHTLSKKYRTEILDYRSSYLEDLYLQNKADIKSKIRVVVRKLIYPIRTLKLNKRREKFEVFYKQYHVLSGKKYYANNIECANECYDAFIAGSDQVWNPHLSRGDWNYFLEFAPAYKRYSYAASMGTNHFSEDNERIRRNIEQFQSVLVRERKTVGFLDSIGVKKKVIPVCDPVFLLSAKEWESILPVMGRRGKSKYVLVYTVANVTKSFEFAKKLARTNNLTVISLSSNQSVNTVSGVKNILDAGPIEFLEYIRNATYVVTSSFHALAFSIIFNIPFFYELCNDGGNNNDRLENIADIFQLENRKIISMELMDYMSDVNWKAVNSALQDYRINSMNTLLESLCDVRGSRNE